MNQKDLIKYGLIALGAYLIYEYIQKIGGVSGLFGTTAAAGTTPTVTPPGITQTVPPLTSVLPNPPITPVTPAPTPVGTIRTINGAPYQWNGATWLAVQATPSTPAPPVASLPAISQRMLSAAGTNNLNMDQWCYYYTQLTGSGCPVDPGSVDPSVYAGAGIVDRTTPTDVGTWLAIMQNQAPQLGLMGLGEMRFTPAWLM